MSRRNWRKSELNPENITEAKIICYSNHSVALIVFGVKVFLGGLQLFFIRLIKKKIYIINIWRPSRKSGPTPKTIKERVVC